MNHYTKTYHQLEMKQGSSCFSHGYLPDIYREAKLLAYNGRLAEAIHEAERATIQSRGNMHGISFRVVTKTETVTWAAGPIDEFVE